MPMEETAIHQQEEGPVDLAAVEHADPERLPQGGVRREAAGAVPRALLQVRVTPAGGTRPGLKDLLRAGTVE
jgi:hypothetical protein